LEEGISFKDIHGQVCNDLAVEYFRLLT